MDQKIPALGGKTPREAVKTADGREAVEALLNGAERGRGQEDFTAEINRQGTQRVREYQNKVKPKFSILKGNTFPVPIQAGFLITVLLDRSHPFQIQIFKAQHNRW